MHCSYIIEQNIIAARAIQVAMGILSCSAVRDAGSMVRKLSDVPGWSYAVRKIASSCAWS